MVDDVMALPALNGSFNPPRPWRCCTTAAHECTGQVVGSMGALPVCAPAAEAEHTARDEGARRLAFLAASPPVRAPRGWGRIPYSLSGDRVDLGDDPDGDLAGYDGA